MTRIAALAAVALLLTACGDQTAPSPRAEDPTEPPSSPATSSTPAGPMPTVVPVASGPVRGIGTVLEADDGPQLCVGGVAESYPPQCGGPAVVNWSWAKVKGQFERANGVRWGSFVVTGTFDGQQVTMTEDPIMLALYDPMMELPAEDPLRTRCPEPTDGWQPVDPATTTQATLDEALRVAAGLEGYGAAWLDQSINPASDDPASEEFERRMNDPRKLVLNVLVTGDVTAAEAALREVWGGSLCVSSTDHTEAELNQVQGEVNELPGMLSSSGMLDHVEVQVLHDDGSLQAWVDAAYGAGLVQVTSALQPVTP